MDKSRILVVDDVAENIHGIINMLKKDYNMVAATNGKKAIEIARKEQQPDLILLDIMMPKMDGFEVCRILKEDESTKNIPIIYVTAMNDENLIDKVFIYDGVDYVQKPLHKKELQRRIEMYLKYNDKIQQK
ncbi:MAG: response regulator [Campylobacterota bacterium]|nr:response regulator [Campylobacterota bacterium]